MKFMKKCFTLLLTIVMIVAATASAIPASAAIAPDDMAAYGQLSFDVNAVKTPPVADGYISKGEYPDPIHVFYPDEEGCYYSLEDAVMEYKDDILPESLTLYMTYDHERLYVAAAVKDESHYTPNGDLQSWDGDYFEFDFTMIQSDYATTYSNKTRFASGMSNTGDAFSYYAAIPTYAANDWGVNNEVHDGTATILREDNITVYEFSITWLELTGKYGPVEKALTYVQLGVAHEKYYKESPYNAYLGVFRCASPLTDEQKAEVTELGGTGSIVMHVLNFVDEVEVPETEAMTFAPEETETEEIETTAPSTTAPSVTTGAPTTEAPESKGGCGSVILAPVVLVATLTVVPFALKKED